MIGVLAVITLVMTSVTATAFSPTVTVTCAVGPEYTVTLADASATGVIFVDGMCEKQDTTATSTHTFNSDACTTSSVPALGTTFTLVVQEYASINLDSDAIYSVTCSLDTTTVTKTVNTAATGGTTSDGTKTPSVSPTFTLGFLDSSTDATLTTGAVGLAVKLSLSIPTNEASVFDFQITSFDATSGSTTVNLIVAGCTAYSDIITQPGTQSGGTLEVPFNLFIPYDASTSPTLPGTSGATVTYTMTIEVCDASCTAPTCSKRRRRRSDLFTNSTIETAEIATSLVIYPAGTRLPNAIKGNDRIVVDNVCLSRTPLIGLLVGMAIALALCVGISAWLFCRLRRPTGKGSEAAFSNTAYQR